MGRMGIPRHVQPCGQGREPARTVRRRLSPYTWRMDAEGWLTSELASFACAACGQPYGESQIRLIAQREELYFVDLSCPRCGSQAVAIVTIQVEPEAGVADAGKPVFSEAGAGDDTSISAVVSVDDVIDVHALLAEFDGDVDQLMARFEGLAP